MICNWHVGGVWVECVDMWLCAAGMWVAMCMVYRWEIGWRGVVT